MPWKCLIAFPNLDNLLIRCHQHLLSMYILSLQEGTGVFTHINSASASLMICATNLNWGKLCRHVQNCFTPVWCRSTTPTSWFMVQSTKRSVNNRDRTFYRLLIGCIYRLLHVPPDLIFLSYCKRLPVFKRQKSEFHQECSILMLNIYLGFKPLKWMYLLRVFNNH